jgi:hypothetical protein
MTEQSVQPLFQEAVPATAADEAAVASAYGKTTDELATEAESGYDVETMGEPKPKRKYVRKPKELIPDDKDIPEITDEELLQDAGVDQVYSTNDVADFFDRSNQWLYWGLRSEGGKPPVFTYEDGTPIMPERVGDPSVGKRRFTLPIIKEILLSAYRRGNVDPEELKKVLRRIRIAELGGNWKTREGWTGRVLDRQVNTHAE